MPEATQTINSSNNNPSRFKRKWLCVLISSVFARSQRDLDYVNWFLRMICIHSAEIFNTQQCIRILYYIYSNHKSVPPNNVRACAIFIHL